MARDDLGRWVPGAAIPAGRQSRPTTYEPSWRSCRPCSRAAEQAARQRRQGQLIEPRQDPLVGVDSVTRCRPGRGRSRSQRSRAKRVRHRLTRPGQVPRSSAIERVERPLRRQQNDARPLDNPVFSLRRSDHGFKRRPLLLRQLDRRRSWMFMPSLNLNSTSADSRH